MRLYRKTFQGDFLGRVSSEGFQGGFPGRLSRETFQGKPPWKKTLESLLGKILLGKSPCIVLVQGEFPGRVSRAPGRDSREAREDSMEEAREDSREDSREESGGGQSLVNSCKSVGDGSLSGTPPGVVRESSGSGPGVLRKILE